MAEAFKANPTAKPPHSAPIFVLSTATNTNRWNADLYSEPVEPCRRQRLDKDAHNKATYQLRAFFERIDHSPSASMANVS